MKKHIEEVWERRELLEKEEYREAVLEAIGLLDRGELRVAEPADMPDN